jgi:plastocyanin
MKKTLNVSLAMATIITLGCAETTPPPDDDNRGVGVVVRDDRFEPGQVTVRVGEDVAWVWEGANSHGVRFLDGPSSAIQVEGVYARVFNSPATYFYYCPVHGGSTGLGVTGMSGRVVVNP